MHVPDGSEMVSSCLDVVGLNGYCYAGPWIPWTRTTNSDGVNRFILGPPIKMNNLHASWFRAFFHVLLSSLQRLLIYFNGQYFFMLAIMADAIDMMGIPLSCQLSLIHLIVTSRSFGPNDLCHGVLMLLSVTTGVDIYMLCTSTSKHMISVLPIPHQSW